MCCVRPSSGKPELPRQPGSSAFYDAESPQTAQTPEGSTEAESPQSTDTNANNFFQTLDWDGTAHSVNITLLSQVAEQVAEKLGNRASNLKVASLIPGHTK